MRSSSDVHPAYYSTPCSNTFWLFCDNIVRAVANIVGQNVGNIVPTVVGIVLPTDGCWGLLQMVGYAISLGFDAIIRIVACATVCLIN